MCIRDSVHGSAILANPYIQERHVNDKEKLCSDQKRAIGAYAARLVEPRDTILIASGTTTLAMAREIREVEELTAITTSLSVATTLAENDECTVIQPVSYTHLDVYKRQTSSLTAKSPDVS